MATKRKPVKREILSREGSIEQWEFGLFVHGSDGRAWKAREGRCYLNARGTLSESVGGVTAFDLMFSERAGEGGGAEASIGAILNVKSDVSGVVDLSVKEYEFAAVLAASGRPCFLHLAFEKPHYGSGLVRSLSISTSPLNE